MVIYYIITNYVSIADTPFRHDLARYVRNSGEGSYNPSEYTAMTMKCENPKSTMIFFSSGNMTIMGATSRFNSLNRFLDMKIAHDFSCFNVRITNIVCTCKFPPINLSDFYLYWSIYCFYEPRLFPGCTVKIPSTSMKANVFSTGKVVLSGGSSIEAIELSLNFVDDLFKKFHVFKKEK